MENENDVEFKEQALKMLVMTHNGINPNKYQNFTAIYKSVPLPVVEVPQVPQQQLLEIVEDVMSQEGNGGEEEQEDEKQQQQEEDIVVEEPEEQKHNDNDNKELFQFDEEQKEYNPPCTPVHVNMIESPLRMISRQSSRQSSVSSVSSSPGQNRPRHDRVKKPGLLSFLRQLSKKEPCEVNPIVDEPIIFSSKQQRQDAEQQDKLPTSAREDWLRDMRIEKLHKKCKVWCRKLGKGEDYIDQYMKLPNNKYKTDESEWIAFEADLKAQDVAISTGKTSFEAIQWISGGLEGLGKTYINVNGINFNKWREYVTDNYDTEFREYVEQCFDSDGNVFRITDETSPPQHIALESYGTKCLKFLLMNSDADKFFTSTQPQQPSAKQQSTPVFENGKIPKPMSMRPKKKKQQEQEPQSNNKKSSNNDVEQQARLLYEIMKKMKADDENNNEQERKQESHKSEPLIQNPITFTQVSNNVGLPAGFSSFAS